VGKIAEQIQKIQIEENITLLELFKKYPHLSELQHIELMEERDQKESFTSNKNKKKQMKLLLD